MGTAAHHRAQARYSRHRARDPTAGPPQPLNRKPCRGGKANLPPGIADAIMPPSARETGRPMPAYRFRRGNIRLTGQQQWQPTPSMM